MPKCVDTLRPYAAPGNTTRVLSTLALKHTCYSSTLGTQSPWHPITLALWHPCHRAGVRRRLTHRAANPCDLPQVQQIVSGVQLTEMAETLVAALDVDADARQIVLRRA